MIKQLPQIRDFRKHTPVVYAVHTV